MDLRIIEGDCVASIRAIDPGSVHCCVTSPPYFGLRDYGHGGQIGLEATPDEYVARLVEVFREVRRVLKDDGTVWLNLGDSYTSGNRAYRDGDKMIEGRVMSYRAPCPDGLKPKDLIGIPWRVAFALQADGWYLRQDIIWHKPNPMPESVRDRCTKAHEYIFLLSKSERYWFDSDAMQEPAVYDGPSRRAESFMRKTATTPPPGQPNQHREGREDIAYTGTRNRRSVWTVATKPYKGAHFATFPPDLIRPCILAGCPKDGTVLDPFGGSGTTALVALEEGRKAVLCELNPEYIDLAKARISGLQFRIA